MKHITRTTTHIALHCACFARQVLRLEPANGYAKVHLGFILKTADNKPEAAIPLMREGIATNEPGVIDSRFFFHLGDSLQRIGRKDEVSGSIARSRALWRRRLLQWTLTNVSKIR